MQTHRLKKNPKPRKRKI